MLSTNYTEETSVTEGEKLSGATKTSTRKKQPESIGEAITAKLLKERRRRVIYREDQNLVFKFKLRYKQNFLT